MRTNRKRSMFIALIAVLMIISVGYALIYTDLKMTGVLGINSNKWDVYWNNVQVTAGSKTPTTAAAIDSNDNTKVGFNVYLENPGDFYEFTVDAVNNGTMDAVIELVDSSVNGNPISTLPNYVSYTATYADGTAIAKNDTLAKKSGSTPTTKKYKIRVEFKSNINASDLDGISELNLNFVFDVSYIQAGTAPKSNWVLPQGKTAATLSTGDEVCVKDQCFNFIKYSGTDAIMLAKWNLKVGQYRIYEPDTESFYTSSDPGYGLQDSQMRGALWSETEYTIGTDNIGCFGTVPFSRDAYWNASHQSSERNYDVYDSINYAGAPELNEYGTPTNPNYSVAYYVEQYKLRLINDYHVSIKQARLLTYSEAIDPSIGCYNNSLYDTGCPTTGDSAFIGNTAFWLGTARYQSVIWWINGSLFSDYYQGPDYDLYYIKDMFGVRPVIVVAQSSL